MDFQLTTAELEDGIFRVAVAGEATLATAAELRTALAEVVDAAARGVLVDLSSTTFIDSTALGVLMGALKRLRPRGGDVVIVCSDEHLRRTFRITLLDRIFAIFDTTEAGLAHLQSLRDRAPVV